MRNHFVTSVSTDVDSAYDSVLPLASFCQIVPLKW